jgi:hypothetical protein
MRKRCASCGRSFTLTGSGKRQKYCSKTCRNHGNRIGPLAGTEGGSNPLIPKGAEATFEKDWIARLKHLQDPQGPIALLGPAGELWRLWPGRPNPSETSASMARHWRLSAKGVLNDTTPPPPRKAKDPAPPKGLRVRLCIESESELQVLGCGWRIVTCQFRGDSVLLHHNGSVASMSRQAFTNLVSANRCLRRKRLKLRLVVSNPESRMAEIKRGCLKLVRRSGVKRVTYHW